MVKKKQKGHYFGEILLYDYDEERFFCSEYVVVQRWPFWIDHDDSNVDSYYDRYPPPPSWLWLKVVVVVLKQNWIYRRHRVDKEENPPLLLLLIQLWDNQRYNDVTNDSQESSLQQTKQNTKKISRKGTVNVLFFSSFVFWQKKNTVHPFFFLFHFHKKRKGTHSGMKKIRFVCDTVTTTMILIHDTWYFVFFMCVFMIHT